MKEILLSQGLTTQVDDEDYEMLMKGSKWCARDGRNTKYAVRRCKKNGYCSVVRLHRYIMGVVDNPDVVVDHIDGNGLNNQRSNLRICTQQQNTFNQPSRGGSSIYRGVSWEKRRKNWISEIYLNGKKKYLGSFKTQEKAAEAYNKAAELYYGSFARLNNITLSMPTGILSGLPS